MDIEKLIAEVFIRVHLWNQAHPDHHNRHVLNGLWQEVAIIVGEKSEVVKKKWKYLRDYFRTEYAKKSKPKSGDPGGSEYISTWPHYESMKFLLDQMTNRQSTGNLSKPVGSNSSSRSSTPVVQFTPVPQDQVSEEIFVDADLSVDDDLSETVRNAGRTDLQETTLIEEPRCALPNRKRKSQSQVIGNALINLEKQKLEYLKSKNNDKPTEYDDEDRSFFDSLIPHVKMIKKESKLLFRNEIQQVVQRFAYSMNYETRSPARSPRSTPSPRPPVSVYSGGRSFARVSNVLSTSTITSGNNNSPANVLSPQDSYDMDEQDEEYKLTNLK